MAIPPFVSIKNLEQYQHYKHRNPPWIKLYYSLLNDQAFLALSEAQQCRYMKLLLIASQQMNCISTDPDYLGKVLRVSEQVDVSPLINAGFLIAHRKHRSSKMLASPHGNRAQSRVETEKRKEHPLPPQRVVLPDWIPENAWSAFLDMRTKIKKPMTERAKEMAMAKLDELRRQGESVAAVLDQSTYHNWQGLFAVKKETPASITPPGEFDHLPRIDFACFLCGCKADGSETCKLAWHGKTKEEVDAQEIRP